jgi:hypothetical protein
MCIWNGMEEKQVRGLSRLIMLMGKKRLNLLHAFPVSAQGVIY